LVSPTISGFNVHTGVGANDVLAAAVPGRLVKYVKDHTKRLYDPRGNKGFWTKEEDDKLLQQVLLSSLLI